jgi:hypothetical protein
LWPLGSPSWGSRSASRADVDRRDYRVKAVQGIGEVHSAPGALTERLSTDSYGPSVGEAIAGKPRITRKPAAAREMVARLVQQCEGQRIFADEWMEREPAIKTNETGAARTKRLRVDDPSLPIDLIFDAGERGPKFRHKRFKQATPALRDAEGDMIRQGGSVQHASLEHRSDVRCWAALVDPLFQTTGIRRQIQSSH